MVLLNENDRWMIVENLSEQFFELEKSNNKELLELKERFGKLLDILSPNWRVANSCKEVKTNPIDVWVIQQRSDY